MLKASVYVSVIMLPHSNEGELSVLRRTFYVVRQKHSRINQKIQVDDISLSLRES